MIFPRRFSNIQYPISNIQSGVTLLLAILVLSALLAISFSLATILMLEIRSSGDLTRTEPALYAATGVAEQAIFNLKRGVTGAACGGTCNYVSTFNNHVALDGQPVVSASTTPTFEDAVPSTNNSFNNGKIYYFWTPANGQSGDNFGQVTLTYLPSNNQTKLEAYMCEYDPTKIYLGPFCSDPGDGPNNPNDPNRGYWILPSANNQPDGNNGSYVLPAAQSATVWTLNPSLQHELILYNTGNTPIYVSITTYGPGLPAGCWENCASYPTYLGLPYVGEAAVTVNALNASVGRKVQVLVPGGQANSSAPSTYSLWSSFNAPASFTTGGSVELGVKFSANENGSLNGISFYKSNQDAANTHTCHLWTIGGAPLGTLTTSAETSSGWQQGTFASPIAITANTTYVASCFFSSGAFGYTLNYFTSAYTNGPLTAPQDGGASGANGVYLYTNNSGGGFPGSTYSSSNYWVDVLFQP